jgi:nucleoside-diphosphate-sugar epimerase
MRTRARYVEVILIVFGVYSVLLGLFMFIAPGTFFDSLGSFGARNDHYIFDNASFEFPLGLMMLAAVRWSSWRVPALTFAALHWGLHALSHIIDPHHAAGEPVGWLEAAGLVVTTVFLAIALRASIVRSRADADTGGRRDKRARTSAVAGADCPRPRCRRPDKSVGEGAPDREGRRQPVVADVFDGGQIDSVVADIEPEVVVSLLTTLPKRGPMRVKDFEPARALWGRGAPNLVSAAQRAGARRIVAESVIFAYGYPTAGPAIMDESDPYPGPPPPGGAEMLAALRGMEQTVLTSGETSDTEGIVLRYGIFYGPDVPHTQIFTRLVKWRAMPAVTGSGIVSWIHIDDVAKATADAVDRGRAGQIYNIVDDRPQSFGDYVRELAAQLHRPRPLPLSRRLFGLVAPYGAIAFGDSWLPLSNAKAKAELGWTPIRR